MRRLLLAGLALLAACGKPTPPEPVSPALWHVVAPSGAEGWLFGTIHALPAPVGWRSAKVDAALDQAGEVLVEVAGGEDPALFARLSFATGLPPLTERIDAPRSDELRRALGLARLTDSQFAEIETWAAAITLANATRGPGDPRHGIDRALLAEARRAGTPVRELEGAERQLRVFDALPEADQRDLLAAVVDGHRTGPADAARLAEAWKRGDIAVLAGETRTGLLADPELHESLYAARNRAWVEVIAARLASGRKPFVAVGAAHVAGDEGLPALLAARGFTLTRVQ